MATRSTAQHHPRSIDEPPSVAYLPSYFNRIGRLDPPRDRLASLLFLDAPLRSIEGRTALQNMITLCKENPQVAYRSSLRPKSGHCPISRCAQDIDRFVHYVPLIQRVLADSRSSASTLLTGGITSIGATRNILKMNMSLPSFAFSVTNGSQLRLHDTSTVNITSTTWKRSQFNMILLSFAGPLLLRDNVSSVCLIRLSRL